MLRIAIAAVNTVSFRMMGADAMCGIFGVVSAPVVEAVGKPGLVDCFLKFYSLAETRGKDAAGYARVSQTHIEVVKRPIRGRAFLKDTALLKSAASASARVAEDGLVMVGHTRMVTNGSANVHHDNQPVIRDGLVGVHNGIIVNDAAIWRDNPCLERRCEVDTEAMLALVEQGRRSGHSLCGATVAAFRAIQGANSVALLSAQDSVLVLATTNGSLFFAENAVGSIFLFASERYILEQILKVTPLPTLAPGVDVHQLRAGSGLFIPFAYPRPVAFRLDDEDVGDTGGFPRPPLDDIAAPQEREIVDLSPPVPQRPAAPSLSRGDNRELERLMGGDRSRIAALRRCTRCLLPETFPFIDFDEQGLCLYCRRYDPIRVCGADALRREADRIRRHDGRPDCLVPLSGGRDSSYGLHYAREVLGLNPVAYTYDWGMVTDLARRNISRLCGALRVEHVLVAADIRRKREFVRMNVAAWLERPHLGMVPLFMAGDKQFFYYADLLRHQMDLGVVMFSMNRLERTLFKSGFCGILDTPQREHTHGMALISKISMAAFFAGQFLSNWRYVNASLLDSASAYASFYWLPKRYISIFDYLNWDEDAIQDTIIGNYNWETSPDSASTWRIGDGTAPFYNYIYYQVAGFSEHETFRSNQIREGMMTRERAAAIVADENRPRPEAFKWYCDTIGIDAVDAVRRINAIPTLY